MALILDIFFYFPSVSIYAHATPGSIVRTGTAGGENLRTWEWRLNLVRRLFPPNGSTADAIH